MRTVRAALARLMGVFTRDRYEADLRAEIESHVEMETAENIRRGMEPGEARRQALLAAGGLTQAAEAVRDRRGLPWLEAVAADVRYAVRHFLRTPLSTVTIVLVLSLGIGTNVVLFTVLNSLATMPAPGISRDESLVRIRGMILRSEAAGANERLLSWPEVQDYAGRTEVFSSVAAYADEPAIVTLRGDIPEPLTVNLIYATPNYFDLLAVDPTLGSEPAAEPDPVRLTTSPTAMISYGMWQQRFGGATDVIGRTVRINDVPVEIVGVAPPRFLGTESRRRITIWVPLAAYPLLAKRSTAAFTSYDSTFLKAAARLRPNVTPQTATPVVAGIATRGFRAGPEDAAGPDGSGTLTAARRATASADVAPMLASNSRVSSRADLLVSSIASGAASFLILLITCANVSALLVGLAVARRREVGVRLSLGAPRRRLIRQLLTESVLLALIAGAVALLLTTLGIRLIGAALGDVQLVLDWPVVIATCGIAIAAGILFGLSPALHATRVSIAEVLKDSAASIGARRSRLQSALVVAQITLTQPLLVGLGVVVMTMVTGAGSGVRSDVADQIAEIELDPWARNLSTEEREASIAAAAEGVSRLPGVIAAMPMQLGSVNAPLVVHPDDRVPRVTSESTMETSLVAAPEGYFEAFEIPIVHGRNFVPAERTPPSLDLDDNPSYPAVIIGSDLARRLWGGANPIGRRLAMGTSERHDSAAMEVVGVVDASATGPSEVNEKFRVYVPYARMNTGVIARTAGPAAPLLQDIRQHVAREAPQMPVASTQTMEQREAASRRELLRAGGAAAAGGLIALMLSAIGLYGVVSFAVGQRRREIGIRTALGARGIEVVRMFFVRGLALSAVGLVLGLPLSFIAIRTISASLNWPLTSAPLTSAAVAGAVLLVASVAVWIPARRASTIDPLVALRAE